VTGAASGIGLATAESLADVGHTVALLDRAPQVVGVAAAMRDRGASAEGWVVDLADPSAVATVTAALGEHYGRCDILVNNAAIHPKRPGGGKYPIPEITLEQWNEVLAVDLTAPFLLSAWALELMRAHRWGRIVNVSSRAGRVYASASGAHYSAAKAGIIGLTRVLAGEAAADNITANCVAPGAVETALFASGQGALGVDVSGYAPIGRLAKPAEIAAAIIFLASEAASFITGAVIDANGGAFG
jgi:3-oxoacyl-[acyl-carrier protein] reductase